MKTLIAVILLVFVLVGCDAGNPVSPNWGTVGIVHYGPKISVLAKTESTTGISPNFWMILAGDRIFVPENLTTDFKVEGKKVRFAGTLSTVTTYGQTILLTKIDSE